MKVEGEKRNTFALITGDFGYVKKKSQNDI